MLHLALSNRPVEYDQVFGLMGQFLLALGIQQPNATEKRVLDSYLKLESKLRQTKPGIKLAMKRRHGYTGRFSSADTIDKFALDYTQGWASGKPFAEKYGFFDSL